MSNAIVVVNATVTLAPTPSTLQSSGAMLTCGGTNTAPGTLSLLTSAADLDAIKGTSKVLASLAWSGATVTATTNSAHGWGVGDVVPVTIAGATPSGYNGTFNGTVTGASTFTYPLADDPGSETIPGTVILGAVAELAQMVTTFFAQPTSANQGVYVLELGESDPTAGVATLLTWIGDNPRTLYSYLVPREWDDNTAFLAALADFNAPNALTYFFVTTTVANRAVYDGNKCVLAAVEAPAIAATEFSLAAEWAVTLNYRPSSTNRVPPLSYGYVYGVTAYPLPGNNTTFTELNAANVGWVGTGAEGGISNKVIFYGQMQDGNPFNFWYSADWAQLNADLNLSNEVINGSNNPANPLYYDQQGIDRLENRLVQTMRQAVSNGLAVGQVKAYKLANAVFQANYNAGLYVGQIAVNAEPFITYSQENPGDYAIGKYGGLAAVYTPARGFKQIIFDLNVTNIIA